MKYLYEIIWYLTLPLTIVVSYFAVLWGLKRFNKNLVKENVETESKGE